MFASFVSLRLARTTAVSELAFGFTGLAGRSLFDFAMLIVLFLSLPLLTVPFLSIALFIVFFFSFPSSPLVIFEGQKLDEVLARENLGTSYGRLSSSGSSTIALLEENHSEPERDGGGRGLFEPLASAPSVWMEWMECAESLSLSLVFAMVSFLRLNQKVEPALVTLTVSFASSSMFPVRSQI